MKFLQSTFYSVQNTRYLALRVSHASRGQVTILCDVKLCTKIHIHQAGIKFVFCNVLITVICHSSAVLLLQVSETTAKDHMDKWTELEEKCARMIGQTKELEKKSVNQMHEFKVTTTVVLRLVFTCVGVGSGVVRALMT